MVSAGLGALFVSGAVNRPNMWKTDTFGPPEPGLIGFHYFSGMNSLSYVVREAF